MVLPRIDFADNFPFSRSQSLREFAERFEALDQLPVGGPQALAGEQLWVGERLRGQGVAAHRHRLQHRHAEEFVSEDEQREWS